MTHSRSYSYASEWGYEEWTLPGIGGNSLEVWDTCNWYFSSYLGNRTSLKWWRLTFWWVHLWWDLQLVGRKSDRYDKSCPKTKDNRKFYWQTLITMNKYHTDQQGETKFIMAMTNEHLVNTIKLLCTKIKNTINMVDPSASRKDLLILGIEVDMGTLICSLEDELSGYLFEACLRWLNITDYLQDAYGRKSANEIDFNF